ncbi:hypothetical protein AN641_03455 [Candidatus Epulonipiscioides gigas]|nr:hypothetical protein AN641_03455 [Epulopiscium sp. SCG-C07WGA-EpuloA2]
MKNNKGVTIIECIISCFLISIIILSSMRYTNLAFDYYQNQKKQDNLYSKSEAIYYFITERIDYSSKVNIPGISFENAIYDHNFQEINCYFKDIEKNGQLLVYMQQLKYKADIEKYTTHTVENELESMLLSKEAMTGLVTIKYKLQDLDEIFFINLNLEGKGLNDQNIIKP